MCNYIPKRQVITMCTCFSVLAVLTAVAFIVPVELTNQYYKPKGQVLSLTSSTWPFQGVRVNQSGLATSKVTWYYWYPPTESGVLKSTIDPLALLVTPINPDPSSTVKVIVHCVWCNSSVHDLASMLTVSAPAVYPEMGCTPSTVQVGVYADSPQQYTLQFAAEYTGSEYCELSGLDYILLVPFALLLLATVIVGIVALVCSACYLSKTRNGLSQYSPISSAPSMEAGCPTTRIHAVQMTSLAKY